MATVRKLVGEIKLADKGSQPLGRFNQKMNKASRQMAATPIQARKASKGIEGIGRSADIASKKVKKVGSGLKTFAASAAGLLGVGIFTAGVKSLTAAFRVQEKVEQELDQRLISTKNAVGLTAKEIKNMASNLQNVTTVGDETILSGQNMLLTFTNIGKDVFPEVTETMLNLTASQNKGIVTLEGVKTSAILLGKALNNPIKGVSALSRVGLTLTKTQIEQIKTFQNAGNIVAAQKVILGELETQVGGTARALAQGSGAFEQLSGIVGDLKEDIGGIIVGALIPLVPKIKSVVLAIRKFVQTEKGMKALKIAFITLAVIVGGIFLSSIIAMLGPLATFGIMIISTIIPAVFAFGATIITTIIPALFSMGVAMFAALGPIGLIILAVIGIVAVFFIFREKIKAFFVATFEFLKAGFFKLLEFFKKFGKFFIIAIFPLAAIFFFRDQILEVVTGLVKKLIGFLSKVPLLGRLFKKTKTEFVVKGEIEEKEKAIRVAGAGTTGRRRKVSDALITSKGDVIEFDPKDNIFATKTPAAGIAGGIRIENLIGQLVITPATLTEGLDDMRAKVRDALEKLSFEMGADLGLN